MTGKPDVKKWQVLIVDDDRDNLNVAAQYLQFLGAAVRTAQNGNEGLEALKTLQPNLILLDLSMPTMDGWQMLTLLRENPETARIPVIALTAHAMPSDRVKVMEAGFDGYITKPFLLASLVDQIGYWLEKAGHKLSGEE